MPVLTPGQGAKVAAVQQAVEAALLADTSASVFVQNGGLNRDYRIAAGVTSIAQEGAAIIDSTDIAADGNQQQLAMGQLYEVAHRLASPFEESSYRGYAAGVSVLDSDLAVLMDKQWWRSIAGVLEAGTPERSDIERIGNVIVYTVSVRLAIDVTDL